MIDPLRTIDANKQACTGVALDYQNRPDLRPACAGQTEFDALVSAYYTLFREQLRGDLLFLKSVSESAGVKQFDIFDEAVYQLRTAKQHSDNAKAAAYYREWVGRHHPWQQAAEALAVEFTAVLQHLEAASSQVRRDPRLAAAWSERASAQPDTIFAAVCADLNVRFTEANRARLIRNVRKRLEMTKSTRDVQAVIKDLCAQEITAQLRSLPVPYVDVLDRLGLIGSRNAKAALLVAYSIQAATSLKGEDFLMRVEQTWQVARG